MAPSTRSQAKKGSSGNGVSKPPPATQKQKDSNRPRGKSSLVTDTAVYFWRETDADYGFLSQWYYCPFTDPEDDSIVYFTAEHYMMYKKALLFNDTKIAAEILQAPSPRDVRSLGRAVSPFSEETWNANRLRIVTEGSLAKFTCAVTEEGFTRGDGEGTKELPSLPGAGGGAGEGKRVVGKLKAALLETGDRELVEASPRDKIWGVGFGAERAESERRRWGLNLLGKALVETRNRLREQEPSEDAQDSRPTVL